MVEKQNPQKECEASKYVFVINEMEEFGNVFHVISLSQTYSIYLIQNKLFS